ncbi:MAG: hypothetical protein IIA67_13790, partial [Planctomycetes bacterium]|nr:hypothetical protein [Planctomycetota bacterium]
GDTFGEFSDWLYLHRETMSVDQIMAEGRRRVGTKPFDRAIESEEVAARLRADIDLVRRFQANSVPRLYLRQGQIRGSPTDDNLERLLNEQFGWPASPAEKSER